LIFPVFAMPKWIDNIIFAVAEAVLYRQNKRLVKCHRSVSGLDPNLANPQRFSDRMLWRKIVDHNPMFVVFADKLAAKEFISLVCPDLPLPKTLWVGKASDEIPDAVLKGDVYVKANHGCDFNFRIRNGQGDRKALREKTQKWLATTYGQDAGEWSYSRVKPALFVEEAIGDAEADLIDIQVRASNGREMIGSIMGKNKTSNWWANYLDGDGNPAPAADAPDDAPLKVSPLGDRILEPYRQAIEYARRLSQRIDYARFDFMWNGRELYGGEITVYPAGGFKESANSATRKIMLDGWDLSCSHFLTAPQTGWKKIYAGALRRRFSRPVANTGQK
jgi:hypothetical protein